MKNPLSPQIVTDGFKDPEAMLDDAISGLKIKPYPGTQIFLFSSVGNG